MLNKVYTNEDRARLQEIDDRMRTELVPEMYARKIHRSTVQSAALLGAALEMLKPRASVIGAGSYEDLVCASLAKLGFRVTDVDPVLNSDLRTWMEAHPMAKFDAVVSTSVLEHTQNDEEFVADCAKLLKKGGICFLTADFLNTWLPGQPTPPTSLRFYRAQDFTGRLKDVIEANGCQLLDPCDWSGADDFWYAGFTYGFAGFCFKRIK